MSSTFVDAAAKGEVEKVREILRSTHGEAAQDSILEKSKEEVVLGLLKAAENNHATVVGLILNSCAWLSLSWLLDKVHQDLDMELLHLAVWTGQVKQVEEELKKKSSGVNALCRGGVTVLHMAAFRGHLEIVSLLLKEPEVKVDAVTADTRHTALHMAADAGHDAVVQVILSASRNALPAEAYRDFLNAKDCLGRTALHYACRHGHSTVVKLLVEDPGIDVNAADDVGQFTPLHVVCWMPGDHAEVVELLINCKHSKIEVNAKADFLALVRPKETVEGLAKADGRIDGAAVIKPEEKVKEKMVEMVKEKVEEKVEEMVKEKVKELASKLLGPQRLGPQLVDATVHSTMVFAKAGFEKRGYTALHLAAEMDNENIVTELLKLKVEIEVNAVEEECGMTPLHCAAMWGKKPGVLTKLLSHTPKDVKEGTDLKEANAVPHKMRIRVEMVTTGQRFYPDRHSWFDSMTAAHIAAYRGSNLLGELLSHEGGKELVDEATKGCKFFLNGHFFYGMTCLHIAAYLGHDNVVTQLLAQSKYDVKRDARAEFHILNHDGKCLASLSDTHGDAYGPQAAAGRPQADADQHHADAYQQLRDELLKMLTAPGLDEERLEELKEAVSVPANVQTALEFLASSNPEVHDPAARVEALLKIFWTPPAQKKAVSRKQHVDRCYYQMTPLHIAAHRGRIDVFDNMLENSASELNAQTSTGDSVLHIAIHERRIHIIKRVCKEADLEANMTNNEDESALRLVWYRWQEAKKSIQKRKDVRFIVEGLLRDKQSFHNAANALIVGGSLIASVTFSGFLQPPFGGYFGSYRPWAVKAFWSFNTLSFFFAVHTLVLSIRIVMHEPERFIEEEVEKLRKGIAYTSSSLTISTAFVIGAFMAAGIGNLPPHTWLPMLLSSVLGGIFVLLFALVPLLRDYREWFVKAPAPNARGLYTDLFQRIIMGKTFSGRTLANIEPQKMKLFPQEPPPGPSQPLHPHRTISSEQASIFRPQPPLHSVSMPLLRQDPKGRSTR